MYGILNVYPSLWTRCEIPECDVGENNREIDYDQPWLRNAIPVDSSNGQLENCVRFARLISNSSTESPPLAKCGPDMFDRSSTIECSEFIYTTDERNVQTEVC